LWEAFLLQMNDFDRFLERRLRDMLDPVIAVQPPSRRRGQKTRPMLSVVAATAPLPGAEPVAVAVEVTPA